MRNHSAVDTNFGLFTVFDKRRLENWRQCDVQILPKNTATGFIKGTKYSAVHTAFSCHGAGVLNRSSLALVDPSSHQGNLACGFLSFFLFSDFGTVVPVTG